MPEKARRRKPAVLDNNSSISLENAHFFSHDDLREIGPLRALVKQQLLTRLTGHKSMVPPSARGRKKRIGIGPVPLFRNTIAGKASLM